ncbi:four-carbon acid sugar kinase family protein [Microbacterium sp. YY-01]|uniref:four-carbon acid sugar kinase family protein n=1 Tax=Microbacterium sp. YY-01 TaxID=3421634 RepID=UPI003D1645AD
MKCLILDDDPTGTQSASDVTVLLRWDADIIAETLRNHDAAYVLTNTRAVDEAEAVRLLTSIRNDRDQAAEELGEPIQIVLRGDSTLRGHVFAETEVFATSNDVVVFLPAFPQGGRTTIDGMHYVHLDGKNIPAHDSEYADDPVFPFDSGYLPEYVAARSSRPTQTVPLAQVRSGALRNVLGSVAPGTVVLPDAETDDDIRLAADAIRQAWEAGASVVVRSASPLAAAIAGVESSGLLPHPVTEASAATLLVCGSHTEGATRQLNQAALQWGEAVTVNTEAALADTRVEAQRLTELLTTQLTDSGYAAVASDRHRRAEHNTLEHGERVMDTLTRVVAEVRNSVATVVSKGGITSADVARIGLGADRAHVRGQVLTGVSVWDLATPEGTAITYVVVPGNVGDPATIVDALTAVQAPVPQH